MAQVRLLCLAFLLCHLTGFGKPNLVALQAPHRLQRKLILAQLGIKEKTGHNDGERIDEYRASVAQWLNLMQPKPAWCACFYYYLFFAIHSPLKVKSARARDYFSATLGSYQPLLHPERVPAFGDAVGYVFGKHRQIAHIGFVYEWNPDPKVSMCRILEGNTSSARALGVVREGDGVYIKWRPKSFIYRLTPRKNLAFNGK